MQKLLVILFFCSLSFYSFSQKILSNLIPVTDKCINSFIPKAWLLIDSTSGDFNKDGIKDYSLVLIDSIAETIAGEKNRATVILKGVKNGFAVSSICDNAFMCKYCGGVHGDPYYMIELKKDMLFLSHYGGSFRKWDMTHKFQYRKGEWVLIGETMHNWWLLINDKWRINDKATYFKDTNFLTGDFIEKDIDDSGKIVKNIKGKKKVKPLIKFKDFNITDN